MTMRQSRGCPSNLRHRRGKRYTMVMMFVVGVGSAVEKFPYYSYHTKPTVREFFVPALTQIGVFLLALNKARKKTGAYAPIVVQLIKCN